MKLSIGSFDNLIPLDMDCVSTISVQSVHYYARLLRSFYFGCSGMEEEIEIALVDDKEKRIPISSKIEFIGDPLFIDFSSKPFTNALVALLKQELNNDVGIRVGIENALVAVQEQVVSLIDDFDLPIKYDDTWDAGKIIKSIGIVLDGDVEGLSHLEILKRYIQIVGNLKMNAYYCFAGLNNVLTVEEMNAFYREALQNQVHIICLQHDIACPTPNEYSYTLFIDDDYDEHISSPFGM